MNNKFDPQSDMPVGLKMALTQNLNALNRFTDLTQQGQIDFIQGAHQVKSKQDMTAYVESLVKNNPQFTSYN